MREGEVKEKEKERVLVAEVKLRYLQPLHEMSARALAH